MNKYNKEFIVDKQGILLEFLRKKFPNKSKNNVKSLLVKNNVYVNNKVQTKYNYELNVNDIVTIKNVNIFINGYDINIIYEDNNIIVVDKPSGILTISTKKEKNITMYHIVREYLKQKNKNNKVFIIHRLDKETSGILMFAKNEKTKRLYQDNWNKIVINKKYYAVVEGFIKKKNGTIKSYLKENKDYYVYSTKDSKNGKLAITEYNVIKEGKINSLVDINLKTGRKNQIRVHMKELGNPIVGDIKYGSSIKKRLCLHAYNLKIIEPNTNKILEFTSNIPKEFYKIL